MVRRRGGDVDQEPFNAADENQVEQRRRDADRDRSEELARFQRVMNSEDGRAFVWRILSSAGVYRTSMTGNSYTFFNEGRRSLGLELMADIHEMPEQYHLMIREAQDRAAARLKPPPDPV